ncbi:uncharacterized protein LOC129765671 [Toxorhynchites rutilus septentrionalis]|uniref:uncharacterized protein LOC129765671 n=1 Tax=Toxorhynchites rutilus septentrionalis TaxID=329112 RepID=UPI0024793A0B|nr:uncharacterized protein LOC129765671 [Toxorhynchites rutilus septentrionalis]
MWNQNQIEIRAIIGGDVVAKSTRATLYQPPRRQHIAKVSSDFVGAIFGGLPKICWTTTKHPSYALSATETTAYRQEKKTSTLRFPASRWPQTLSELLSFPDVFIRERVREEPFHASTSGSDFAEEITIIDEEYLDATDENNADEILPKKPSNRRSKKKLSTEQSTIQAAVNELKELNNNLTVSASSMGEPEDECEAIGRHVIMQLRQLSPIDRIDATDEIHAILSRYRKNALCVSRMQYTYSDHEYTETSQATVGFPPRSP